MKPSAAAAAAAAAAVEAAAAAAAIFYCWRLATARPRVPGACDVPEIAIVHVIDYGIVDTVWMDIGAAHIYSVRVLVLFRSQSVCLADFIYVSHSYCICVYVSVCVCLSLSLSLYIYIYIYIIYIYIYIHIFLYVRF